MDPFKKPELKNDLDAKLYGAYWCGYTNAQKERLGKQAMKQIQYVECAADGINSQRNQCATKQIPGFPTWEISGVLYPGDQELDELETIVSTIEKGGEKAPTAVAQELLPTL